MLSACEGVWERRALMHQQMRAGGNKGTGVGVEVWTCGTIAVDNVGMHSCMHACECLL